MLSGINRFFTSLEEKTDQTALTNYPAFFVGNEPEFTGLESYQAREGKVVLIATSMMRSVWVACQLSGHSIETPQIILIDNSKCVHFLWKKIKEYLEKCEKPGIFFSGLNNFLNTNRKAFIDYAGHDQKVINHFNLLFRKYGYLCVKSIIAEMCLIQQSFADKAIFERLKMMLSDLNIKNVYMYVSNILHYVSEDTAEKIMENIAMINPGLSIYTDIINKKPRHFFLCQDSTADSVRSTLFPAQKGPFSFRMESAPVMENYFGCGREEQNHKRIFGMS